MKVWLAWIYIPSTEERILLGVYSSFEKAQDDFAGQSLSFKEEYSIDIEDVEVQ